MDMGSSFVFNADCMKDVQITCRIANAGGEGVFILSALEAPAPDEQRPPAGFIDPPRRLFP